MFRYMPEGIIQQIDLVRQPLLNESNCQPYHAFLSFPPTYPQSPPHILATFLACTDPLQAWRKGIGLNDNRLTLAWGARRSSQIHTTYRSRVSIVLPEELDRSIYINASFACSKVKTLSIVWQSAPLAHLETAPRWALLRALDTDLVVAPYSMYNFTVLDHRYSFP